jgi:hypothetical protein
MEEGGGGVVSFAMTNVISNARPDGSGIYFAISDDDDDAHEMRMAGWWWGRRRRTRRRTMWKNEVTIERRGGEDDDGLSSPIDIDDRRHALAVEAVASFLLDFVPHRPGMTDVMGDRYAVRDVGRMRTSARRINLGIVVEGWRFGIVPRRLRRAVAIRAQRDGAATSGGDDTLQRPARWQH